MGRSCQDGMRILRFCLAFPAFFAVAPPAFAHKLQIDWRITDQRLHIEAFYDDNTPAQQATITIKNEKNEILASGKTDEHGVWTCTAPTAGKYTARAETAGHLAQESFLAPEAPSSQPSSNSEQPSKTGAREEETATPWLRILFGCAAIAALFFALWLARRRFSWRIANSE
jgi:hypothetical protein